MEKSELISIVTKLRTLGREGGYWDFKKEYHKNKAELLIDIICMANNQEDRDAYIIFGIEDKTMKVIGVENDPNRKNLNQLSQFISGKYFSVYTPEIDLQTIEIEGHQIDVLIIYNTAHTPYYLEKDFKDQKKIVHQGQIYIRLNDHKEGYGNQAAPYCCIEHLWKKRFGINLSIMNRLSLLLEDVKGWQLDWNTKRYAYHKSFPEFRIEQVSEFEFGWEPIAAFYTHPDMHLADLHILYHNTIIYETQLWALDNYRKFLPKAEIGSVEDIPKSWYFYYDLSSIEGKLLTLFTQGSNNISSREVNYNQILLFNNMNDIESYNDYFKIHFNNYIDEDIEKKYEHEIGQDIEENGGGRVFSAFHIARAITIYEDYMNDKKA